MDGRHQNLNLTFYVLWFLSVSALGCESEETSEAVTPTEPVEMMVDCRDPLLDCPIGQSCQADELGAFGCRPTPPADPDTGNSEGPGGQQNGGVEQGVDERRGGTVTPAPVGGRVEPGGNDSPSQGGSEAIDGTSSAGGGSTLGGQQAPGGEWSASGGVGPGGETSSPENGGDATSEPDMNGGGVMAGGADETGGFSLAPESTGGTLSVGGQPARAGVGGDAGSDQSSGGHHGGENTQEMAIDSCSAACAYVNECDDALFDDSATCLTACQGLTVHDISEADEWFGCLNQSECARIETACAMPLPSLDCTQTCQLIDDCNVGLTLTDCAESCASGDDSFSACGNQLRDRCDNMGFIECLGETLYPCDEPCGYLNDCNATETESCLIDCVETFAAGNAQSGESYSCVSDSVAAQGIIDCQGILQCMEPSVDEIDDCDVPCAIAVGCGVFQEQDVCERICTHASGDGGTTNHAAALSDCLANAMGGPTCDLDVAESCFSEAACGADVPEGDDLCAVESAGGVEAGGVEFGGVNADDTAAGADDSAHGGEMTPGGGTQTSGIDRGGAQDHGDSADEDGPGGDDDGGHAGAGGNAISGGASSGGDQTIEGGTDALTGGGSPLAGGQLGGGTATGEEDEIAVCGDGIIAGTEECDDGDLDPGDGCAADCTVEMSFFCPREGGACVEGCGDSITNHGEECDDGNSNDDDGCSRICRVEPGWTCTRDGRSECSAAECGDGLKIDDEECDDANANNGDGCSEGCIIESGWACDAIEGCVAARCGDGLVRGDEECDDGLNGNGETEGGDGCSATCQIEPGYVCPADENNPDARSDCDPECGDGVVIAPESCDDGNLDDGDGCNFRCAVEAGWQCGADGCTGICGNGVVEDEACDDGNENDDDGCTSECAIVPGWFCEIEENGKSTCRSVCGDGIKVGTEACDDNNFNNDDGCASAPLASGANGTCTVEPGWLCPNAGVSCVANCGDGIVTENEECDDGDDDEFDSCNTSCLINPGWTCGVVGQDFRDWDCRTICGDGLKVGDEECDDDNFDDGDGCQSALSEAGENGTCTVEGVGRVGGDLWRCEQPEGDETGPTVCHPVCGNGVKQDGEQCDDGNDDDTDGCTNNTCTFVEGYECVQNNNNVATQCTPICGDGLRLEDEECDDGNFEDGDGCQSARSETGENGACVIERQNGWDCVQLDGDDRTPSDCNPICGDGLKRGREKCDDGDRDDTNGCTNECTIAEGWTCSEDSIYVKSICSALCGDGLVVGNEGCDDGNLEDDDGCASEPLANGNGNDGPCAIEPVDAFTKLWTCPHAGQPCDGICGDGVRRGQEACDDGDRDDDDGCANDCTILPGYSCSEQNPNVRSVCQAGCGDGVRRGDEACDDGNVDDDDGCTNTCKVPNGWTCEGEGAATICNTDCGDGVRRGDEACDDGNENAADGCDACSITAGWTCNETNVNSRSRCEPACGDGILVGNELCDDGNVAGGDGCSDTCTSIEDGWDCIVAGDPCIGVCGDGLKRDDEACDDGNQIADDGCDACTIKAGWTCSEDNSNVRSECKPLCGDNIIVGDERCDDGNEIGGDGCNANCTLIEEGWDCPGAGQRCVGDCGDGLKRGDEECDDGDTEDTAANRNDGCTLDCTIVDGWSCVEANANVPSQCEPGCGDGLRQGNEPCDDGNENNNDGCTTTCKITHGWTCSEPVGPACTVDQDCPGSLCENGACVLPSQCETICGDGLKRGDEQCDDGDDDELDGCTSQCTILEGWECGEENINNKSICNPICGDGLKLGPEECDDKNIDESDDGCTANCEVSFGWTCRQLQGDNRKPSDCDPICGDGIRRGAEECDDGDDVENPENEELNNADGCTITCTEAVGWSCEEENVNARSICRPICGDGLLLGNELCDDGNTDESDDGCTQNCTVGTGWTCEQPDGDKTVPSQCTADCGDGIKRGDEECDDGDNNEADGCTTACTISPGYSCSEASINNSSICQAGCGDGIIQASEACDDGNNDDDDGCASTCKIVEHWRCEGDIGQLSQCQPICGDGYRRGQEECDDGNDTNEDGCNNECAIVPGWSCTEATTDSRSACQPGCGNGLKQGSEACDDANDANEDGCTTTCKVLMGWTCEGEGASTVCETICGDGYRRGTEGCDDGNENPADGCDACAVIEGWSCSEADVDSRTRCEAICGDSRTYGAEACDDGLNAEGVPEGGDGCSANCTVELGWTCEQGDAAEVAGEDEFGVSTCSTLCGDGLWIPEQEACDDGDDNETNGCTNQCIVQPGWTCEANVSGRSICKTTCGDGQTVGSEACDDGNTAPGDGCSATCTVEANWNCINPNGAQPSDCSLGNTINLDDNGTNDFDPASEAFETSSDGYTAYVTWDENYLYFAIDGPDVAPNNGGKVVVAYFGNDGDISTNLGLTFNTQTPALAMNATHAMFWQTNENTGSRTYDGTAWQDAGWNFEGDIYRNGTYVEFRVPFVDLGINTPFPFPLDVNLVMLNQAPGQEWTYARLTGGDDGDDIDYTRFFRFIIGGPTLPNGHSPTP